VKTISGSENSGRMRKHALTVGGLRREGGRKQPTGMGKGGCKGREERNGNSEKFFRKKVEFSEAHGGWEGTKSP